MIQIMIIENLDKILAPVASLKMLDKETLNNLLHESILM